MALSRITVWSPGNVLTSQALNAEFDNLVSGVSTAGGVLPTAFTIGDLVYASTTAALSALADVTAGSYLRSGGVGVAPLWSTLTLPNAATTGDLPYASATNTISMLTATGPSGAYLRGAGAGGIPAWSAIALPNALTLGDLLVATSPNVMGVLSLVTKGSLLAGNGTQPATLAVGVNGTVPVADSGAATGISWLAPSGASVLASQTTTSLTYADLTTVGPAVTVTIGASGKAIVSISAWLNTDTANGLSLMSFAVSGATTIAAADNHLLFQPNAAGLTGGYGGSYFVSGLTPGSNTFTAKYRVNSGTGQFSNRFITVFPL